MKKVLLHICCGPCVIFPLEVLNANGFLVEGFFYNPNIQPADEYRKRKDVMRAAQDIFGITVHMGDYEEAFYRDAVKGAHDAYARCSGCFDLRLTKTFQYAEANDFDYFTTTLLVSPYQDQQLINAIGVRIAKDSSVQFLFDDFRPGFRKAHTRARELGLYSQKYCGCLASLEERKQEKAQKRKKSVNVTC